VCEVAPRKPIERVNDNDLDPAAILTTVGKKLLELGSFRGLGRFATLDEDPIHAPTLVLAEPGTGLPLGR
jgi:hypothetical protein